MPVWLLFGPVMVEADVYARKGQAVAHHIARMRARGSLTAGALAADEDLWNLTLMDLLQAIQPCIDLATHAVVRHGLGVVDGPASCFGALATAGWIPRENATAMAAAAGLRNLIAHRYGDLSHDLVAKAIGEPLNELVRFVDLICERVEPPLTPA